MLKLTKKERSTIKAIQGRILEIYQSRERARHDLRHSTPASLEAAPLRLLEMIERLDGTPSTGNRGGGRKRAAHGTMRRRLLDQMKDLDPGVWLQLRDLDELAKNLGYKSKVNDLITRMFRDGDLERRLDERDRVFEYRVKRLK